MRASCLEPTTTWTSTHGLRSSKQPCEGLSKSRCPRRAHLVIRASSYSSHAGQFDALLEVLQRCQTRGLALATQVSRLVLAEISEVPVTLMSDRDLHAAIKQDLVNSLAAKHCPPEELDLNASPSKRRRMNDKQTQGWKESIAAKTDHVFWMVRNRVATKRVAQTITEGSSVVSKLLKHIREPRRSCYGMHPPW